MKNFFLTSLALTITLALAFTSCTRENVRGDRVIRNAVTDKDGNHYDAVKIGNQVWMQSNLRTKHFRDGSTIPRCSSYVDDYTEPCYYQSTMQQVPTFDEKKYGLYYNWAAVGDTRGLCPKGWHVPTVAEWNELLEYVGSKSEYVYGGNPQNIAKALASNVGWVESNEPGAPGFEPENNNATGFTAVPAGYYRIDYVPYGYITSFWSYVEYGLDHDLYLLDFWYNCVDLSWDYDVDGGGCSVRCVRD